ncbi:hypothetical protein FHT77_006492 [Rhizobium sp. BK181]|nr:hypothetical protein [Rhizobium sp. BK181]
MSVPVLSLVVVIIAVFPWSLAGLVVLSSWSAVGVFLALSCSHGLSGIVGRGQTASPGERHQACPIGWLSAVTWPGSMAARMKSSAVSS